MVSNQVLEFTIFPLFTIVFFPLQAVFYCGNVALKIKYVGSRDSGSYENLLLDYLLSFCYRETMFSKQRARMAPFKILTTMFHNAITYYSHI